MDRRPSSDFRRSRWLTLAAVAALIGVLVYSYASGGIVAAMSAGDLSAEEKLLILRARFDELGPAGPVAYVLLVMVEVVVAPLPGAMLYAPGGAIFGGFWGGLLALIGNVLGAGLSCNLVRILGGERLERLIEREAVNRYVQRLERHGVWVVFLLRVNPITSSDLVSYAAGATPLRTWKLMLGTALGMAPLCFAQAYLAQGLMDAMPSLIYPLLIGSVIYTLLAIAVIRTLLIKRPKELPAEAQL